MEAAGENPRVVFRANPLRPLLRALLILLGTVFLALGVLGIYLPGLPTTPFLLLAAACYARSSDRLYRWLLSRPRFGAQLQSFVETKALPWKLKVVSLLLAWAVLGGLALFVVSSVWMKGLLIGLALVKTAVLLSLPTVRE